MRLLSLDLATTLGWASGDTEAGDPVSGIRKLPSTGDDIGRFLVAYNEFLQQLIADQRPDLIVMEAPMPTQSGRSTQSTILKLYGLCSHTEMVAVYKRIEVRQVAAATWKKGFCGNGRASKSDKPYPVITRCHALGWEHVKNDNEADALGIWTYSVRFASPGKEQRFDPLFYAA